MYQSYLIRSLFNNRASLTWWSFHNHKNVSTRISIFKVWEVSVEVEIYNRTFHTRTFNIILKNKIKKGHWLTWTSIFIREDSALNLHNIAHPSKQKKPPETNGKLANFTQHEAQFLNHPNSSRNYINSPPLSLPHTHSHSPKRHRLSLSLSLSLQCHAILPWKKHMLLWAGARGRVRSSSWCAASTVRFSQDRSLESSDTLGERPESSP